jgi:hypothetical protein
MADNRQSDGRVSKRGTSPASLANLTGGSRKGVPNKATAAIREIAGQYTEQAVTTLVSILAGGEGIPAAAQVAAAKELLDRAHGKPSQSVDVSGDMTFKGLEVVIRR